MAWSVVDKRETKVKARSDILLHVEFNWLALTLYLTMLGRYYTEAFGAGRAIPCTMYYYLLRYYFKLGCMVRYLR